MTHNQIDYQVHKETVRHNVATESETERNNQVFAAETNRHNLATETNVANANAINASHYAKQDEVAAGQLEETKAHNRASESIGYVQASASVTQASAAIANARTNEQNARINALNAATASNNATTNKKNVDNQYRLGSESNKTNKFNAETQASAVGSQNELRKAQTLKTHVNIGTDILDSLSGHISRTINSMSNFIGMGSNIAKAFIGGM